MTHERLARLRFLANFAAYHIPGASDDRRTDADRAKVKDADAGDDMLELCEALSAQALLVSASRAFVKALESTKFDVFIGTPTELLRLKEARDSVLTAIQLAERRCDHKFVDSTSCLKCGWTPPLTKPVLSDEDATNQRLEDPRRI